MRTEPRSTGALALSLALLVSPLAAAQRPLPAEAIAATVGGPTPAAGVDVVLLSDVELRARIELALAGSPDVRRVPPELLGATLEQIVGELLVAREAARLGTAEPTEADRRREHERLVTTLGGPDEVETFLRAHEATMAELDTIAERRARVSAFFRANLEGTGEISDAQVEERYLAGDHPFGDRLLEEIREPLRAWMASEAVRADVARWIEVLRARTVVRVFLPELERAPAPDEGADSR